MGSLSSRLFLAAGIVALALGALIREAIGTTSLLVLLAVSGWLAVERVRGRRRRSWSLLLVAALALLASLAPRLVVAATRDSLFPVVAAKLIATHGMSHTLYIGLGAVENKFGIRYEDDYGRRAAAAVAPGVEYQSPAYLEVMWRLYLERLRQDPKEVARIYFEKLRLIMSDRILESAPPLWLFLALAATIHLLCNEGRLSCGSPACDRRLAINLVALAFVALIVLQVVLAVPTRYYGAPIGAFLLVMCGVALENLAGWAWRRARPHLSRPA